MRAAGRALLAEDLRSPCPEEIAVFRAFAPSRRRSCGGYFQGSATHRSKKILLVTLPEATPVHEAAHWSAT